jgi:hypothetical protein
MSVKYLASKWTDYTLWFYLRIWYGGGCDIECSVFGIVTGYPVLYSILFIIIMSHGI